MSNTRYCYHCGKSHPENEMRQIVGKNGTRWRCIKSINASKKTTEERDAFGKMVSAKNAEIASSSHIRQPVCQDAGAVS